MEALLPYPGEERTESAPPSADRVGISIEYAAQLLRQMDSIADDVDPKRLQDAISRILHDHAGVLMYMDSIRELLPAELKKEPCHGTVTEDQILTQS